MSRCTLVLPLLAILLGSGPPGRSVLQLARDLLSAFDGDLGRLAAAELVELEEVHGILTDLRQEDPEFDGSARMVFSRPPYEIRRDHTLVRSLAEAVRAIGRGAGVTGMTFWTDAATSMSRARSGDFM